MGQSIADLHPNLGAAPQMPERENYVRTYSLGSLLRTVIHLYGRHFKPIFFAYILPTVPVALLQSYAQLHAEQVFVALTVLLSLIVGYFATGAITVTVSDICLGNEPSLRR